MLNYQNYLNTRELNSESVDISSPSDNDHNLTRSSFTHGAHDKLHFIGLLIMSLSIFLAYDFALYATAERNHNIIDKSLTMFNSMLRICIASTISSNLHQYNFFFSHTYHRIAIYDPDFQVFNKEKASDICEYYENRYFTITSTAYNVLLFIFHQNISRNYRTS